jgi:hypothetical protein
MSKYTQDNYFAAASAQDLWAFDTSLTGPEACIKCGSSYDLFDKIWVEAEKILEGMFDSNLVFIAIQFACEKAGL